MKFIEKQNKNDENSTTIGCGKYDGKRGECGLSGLMNDVTNNWLIHKFPPSKF